MEIRLRTPIFSNFLPSLKTSQALVDWGRDFAGKEKQFMMNPSLVTAGINPK